MSAGPQVGDPAPDAILLAGEGGRVQLSSFWKERPAVLVFLRYFGCPFCQMHVVKLREDQQLFRDAGAAYGETYGVSGASPPSSDPSPR